MSRPLQPTGQATQRAIQAVEQLERLAGAPMEPCDFYREATRLVAKTLGSDVCRLSVVRDGRSELLGSLVSTASEPFDSAEEQIPSSTVRSQSCQLSNSTRMTLDVQVPTSEQRAQPGDFTDSLLASVLELCVLVYLKASYQRSDSLRSADLSTGANSSALYSRRWLVGFVGLLACVMLAIPVDFHLPVEGVIEPTSRARIFAPVSGTVLQTTFQDDQLVDQGDVLIKLSNTDLQLRYETAVGELATAKAEFSSLRAGQTQRGADDVSTRTSSRQLVLRTKIGSLEDHVDLLEHVIESSTVTAPMQGQVSRPDHRDDLLGNSVMQGQWLLDVVDPSGGYEARMELRDVDRVYLAQAMKDKDATENTERSAVGLPCIFRLRSAPEAQLVGAVTELPHDVQWNQRGESVIRIRVVMQQGQASYVREGSTVVGHVVAGKRALGFVWFRPLIEFFRSLGW